MALPTALPPMPPLTGGVTRASVAYPRARFVVPSWSNIACHSSGSGSQCGGCLKRATSSTSTESETAW